MGIAAHLAVRGLLRRGGMMEGTTIIIASPCPSKADARALVPQMRHRANKGIGWPCDRNASICADGGFGLVNRLPITATNERDVVHTNEVLSGQRESAFRHAIVTGVATRAEIIESPIEGKVHSANDCKVDKRCNTPRRWSRRQ